MNQYRISYIKYDMETAWRLGLLGKVWNRKEMMSDIADSILAGPESEGDQGHMGLGEDSIYGGNPYDHAPLAAAYREAEAMMREADEMMAYAHLPLAADPFAEADMELAALEKAANALFEDPMAEEIKALDAERNFLETAPLRRPAYYNGQVYIVTHRGYE